MTEQEITRLTNEVFEESFEIDGKELEPDKEIFADLGLDSLDVVDLVVALQQKFGVHIRDDGRVRGIRTLGDIYRFIHALQEERGLQKRPRAE